MHSRIIGYTVVRRDIRQGATWPVFLGLISPGRLLTGAVMLAVTAGGLYLAYWLVRWALLDSVWGGSDASVCQSVSGACWTVIAVRYRIILFGLYPYDEQWRAALAIALLLGALILVLSPRNWTPMRIAAIWCLGFGLLMMILRGGLFSLPLVTSDQWGGLTLTLFIFAAVLSIGMPLSVAITLARRSRLPALARLAGGLVDATRSVPFLAVIYAAAVVLPIALPSWLEGDRLSYVIAGFSLHYAAYQSEVLRGGLQSIPRGQFEAAEALGLTPWKRMYLVVLPQAFRISLPATINEIVTVFKETSVIAIVGLFDLTASAHAAFEEGSWNDQFMEIFVFVSAIYFIFSASISRYGAFLEKRHRFY
ncbi:MAG: amino acid ABC transporter permease [Mesorhizobium sp.]|nr:MAG: amino acid ABC transporter permease [Mesorhizobium sp.]TIO70087.1 MAG: amino acid ABC transporter permease [Mesorhizobium sp.]TJV93979.1 MAG: amino acid ABC transporter permease [Mesorhizobium sp.]